MQIQLWCSSTIQRKENAPNSVKSWCSNWISSKWYTKWIVPHSSTLDPSLNVVPLLIHCVCVFIFNSNASPMQQCLMNTEIKLRFQISQPSLPCSVLNSLDRICDLHNYSNVHSIVTLNPVHKEESHTSSSLGVWGGWTIGHTYLLSYGSAVG